MENKVQDWELTGFPDVPRIKRDVMRAVVGLFEFSRSNRSTLLLGALALVCLSALLLNHAPEADPDPLDPNPWHLARREVGGKLPAHANETHPPASVPPLSAPPPPPAPDGVAPGQPKNMMLDYMRDRMEPWGTPATNETKNPFKPRDREETVEVPSASVETWTTKRDSVSQTRLGGAQGRPASIQYPAAAEPDNANAGLAILVLMGAGGCGLVALSVAFQMQRLADRRRSSRRQVAQAGRVVSAALSAPVDCMILDLSLGGARLGLSEPTWLPDKFDLIFLQTGLERHAEVRWEQDLQLGIRFED